MWLYNSGAVPTPFVALERRRCSLSTSFQMNTGPCRCCRDYNGLIRHRPWRDRAPTALSDAQGAHLAQTQCNTTVLGIDTQDFGVNALIFSYHVAGSEGAFCQFGDMDEAFHTLFKANESAKAHHVGNGALNNLADL